MSNDGFPTKHKKQEVSAGDSTSSCCSPDNSDAQADMASAFQQVSPFTQIPSTCYNFRVEPNNPSLMLKIGLCCPGMCDVPICWVLVSLEAVIKCKTDRDAAVRGR